MVSASQVRVGFETAAAVVALVERCVGMSSVSGTMMYHMLEYVLMVLSTGVCAGVML